MFSFGGFFFLVTTCNLQHLTLVVFLEIQVSKTDSVWVSLFSFQWIEIIINATNR